MWQRVFNKIRILDYEGTNRERIRFVNQVLDSIKLSAITGTELNKNFYLKTIFPVVRYSSSANTWYIYDPFFSSAIVFLSPGFIL
jgi:hypothetical protein